MLGETDWDSTEKQWKQNHQLEKKTLCRPLGINYTDDEWNRILPYIFPVNPLQNTPHTKEWLHRIRKEPKYRMQPAFNDILLDFGIIPSFETAGFNIKRTNAIRNGLFFIRERFNIGHSANTPIVETC
jgi:hypothetical protein